MEGERLQGRRILVIEDDYLVACALVDVLEQAGATVLGPIGWIDEAIAFIDSSTEVIDAAVLDINLHGMKSYAVADALSARNVLFAFTTGYAAEAVKAEYRHYPRCEKPISRGALLAALT